MLGERAWEQGFAIAYVAQSSNLDIKLIVTCTDDTTDTTARARIMAKLLTIIAVVSPGGCM